MTTNEIHRPAMVAGVSLNIRGNVRLLGILGCLAVVYGAVTAGAASNAGTVIASFAETNLHAVGSNRLQFAPNGTLAMVADTDSGPVYRMLSANFERWDEESLPQSSLGSSSLTMSSLFFDSQGVPNILTLSSGELLHYYRNSEGWIMDQVAVNPYNNSDPTAAAVMLDHSNNVHMATYGWPSGITYANNKNGEWVLEDVADGESTPISFAGVTFTPRFISMAIDSKFAVHIAYGSFDVDGNNRSLSKLHYATNKSGAWKTEVVNQVPRGKVGDAGFAAAIAINPISDQPAIVSCYISRVPTFSATGAKLLYHSRDSRGWQTEVLLDKSDKYNAHDGPHGTGINPDLHFDKFGRAHIVFSDLASQHFLVDDGIRAQAVFSGQIRYIRKLGGKWIAQTIYRQSDPLHQEIDFPSIAIADDRVAFIGSERLRENSADFFSNPKGYGSSTIVNILRVLEGITPIPPTIISSQSVTGKVGATFGYTILGSNNPIKFTAAPLPSGLRINTKTGKISGTPRSADTYTVNIGVSNTGGMSTSILSIIIAP